MAPLNGLAIAIAAGFFIGGCSVQRTAVGAYAESFDPQGSHRVVIEGVDGDLNVVGTDEDRIVMRGTRTAVGATTRLAHERLDDVFLTPFWEGSDLLLAFAPDLSNRGLVSLELDGESELPAFMGFSAELAQGDISLVDLEGPVEVRTGRGAIAIDDPGLSSLRATTESGSIDYAFDSESFRLECRVGGGGLLAVAPEILTLIESGQVSRVEENGAVVFSRGDGVKQIFLEAAAGEIAISLLSSR